MLRAILSRIFFGQPSVTVTIKVSERGQYLGWQSETHPHATLFVKEQRLTDKERGIKVVMPPLDSEVA